MTQDNKKSSEWIPLFLASMEGTISNEDFSELNRLLSRDASAREFYYDFIASYIGLNCLEILSEANDDDDTACLSQKLWDELSGCESKSSGMYIQKAYAAPDTIQIDKGQRRRTVHDFNKVTLVTAILSLAAVFFLLVFIYIGPSLSGKAVASLSDTFETQWYESEKLSGPHAAQKRGSGHCVRQQCQGDH
jgi:hypothetical protein